MNEEYGYKWRVSTGEFFYNQVLLCVGYSGQPPYKNDPGAIHLHGLGPIPFGAWTFGGAISSETMGPHTIPILPSVGTETYGRSGFFMHGDSISHPGFASHGCPIAPRDARLRVINNMDKRLQVIP